MANTLTAKHAFVETWHVPRIPTAIPRMQLADVRLLLSPSVQYRMAQGQTKSGVLVVDLFQNATPRLACIVLARRESVRVATRLSHREHATRKEDEVMSLVKSTAPLVHMP